MPHDDWLSTGLIYLAAALTLISMFYYMKLAAPSAARHG